MPTTQHIYTFSLSHLLPFLIGIVIMMGPQISCAQLDLPKPEVLAELGIKTIQVTKTQIRMEDWEKKDISDQTFDRTPYKIATYFMNTLGQIDSMYHYFGNDTTNFDKHVFRYAFEDRLAEISIISSTGEVQQRTLVEKTSENDWYYRLWQKNELKTESWSTSDSITYKSIWYNGREPIKLYSVFTYNLENDIRTDTYFEEEEVITKKTYQWVSNNGIPDHFKYSKYSKGEGKRKPKSESKELKISETGTIINKLNGLFTDPFDSFNYFERHVRFMGIEQPYESLFTGDKLITKKEISELYRFDGTEIVYEYGILYESN